LRLNRKQTNDLRHNSEHSIFITANSHDVANVITHATEYVYESSSWAWRKRTQCTKQSTHSSHHLPLRYLTSHDNNPKLVSMWSVVTWTCGV